MYSFFPLLDKPDREGGVFLVVAGYLWWLYVFGFSFLICSCFLSHFIENKASGGFSQ